MLNVQAAGARGAIVANDEAGGLLVEMGGDGSGRQPGIPALGISADAGAALRCEGQPSSVHPLPKHCRWLSERADQLPRLRTLCPHRHQLCPEQQAFRALAKLRPSAVTANMQKGHAMAFSGWHRVSIELLS